MDQPTFMLSARFNRFLTGGFKYEFSELRTPPSLHSTFNSSRAYSSSTATTPLLPMALIVPPKSTKLRISEILAKISTTVHEAQDDVSVVDHDAMLILSLIELLGELIHITSQEDRTTNLEVFYRLSIILNKAIKYIIIPTIERLRSRVAKFASDERILQIRDFLSIVFSMAKEWRFEKTFVDSVQVVKLLRVTRVLQLHYIKQKNRLSLYHEHTTTITNALLVLIDENVNNIQTLLERITRDCLPTHEVFEYLTYNVFRNQVHLADIQLLDDFLKSFQVLNEYYSDSLQFSIQKLLIKAKYHQFLVDFEKFPENRETLILYLHTWMRIYCEVYQSRSFESDTVIRRPSMGNLNPINHLIAPGMAMRRLELGNLFSANSYEAEVLQRIPSPENNPLPPENGPIFIIAEDSPVERSVSPIGQVGPIDSVAIYKKRDEGSLKDSDAGKRLQGKVPDNVFGLGKWLGKKILPKRKSTSKVKGCWKCKLSPLTFHEHFSQ